MSATKYPHLEWCEVEWTSGAACTCGSRSAPTMSAPKFTERKLGRYGKLLRVQKGIPQDERCAASTTMADGSGSQCMRRKKFGEFCTQHAKMHDSHVAEL